MLVSETSAAAFPLTRFRDLARMPDQRNDLACQVRHTCRVFPISARIWASVANLAENPLDLADFASV